MADTVQSVPIEMLIFWMFFLFQCDAGRGAAVMYDLLYNEPQKVILLFSVATITKKLDRFTNKYFQ